MPNSLLVFHWWDEISSIRVKLKNILEGFFFKTVFTLNILVEGTGKIRFTFKCFLS